MNIFFVLRKKVKIFQIFRKTNFFPIFRLITFEIRNQRVKIHKNSFDDWLDLNRPRGLAPRLHGRFYLKNIFPNKCVWK